MAAALKNGKTDGAAKVNGAEKERRRSTEYKMKAEVPVYRESRSSQRQSSRSGENGVGMAVFSTQCRQAGQTSEGSFLVVSMPSLY